MTLRTVACAVAIGVTATVLAAMPAQAAPLLPTATVDHQDLVKLATTLEERLGDRSAGSYLDEVTGKLTVTVTDDSAAQSVRAASAIPRRVARSRAELRRATEELDRSARIPGTAWAVDPVTNQVVISVDESVHGAELARLESIVKKLGEDVRVESVTGRLSTLASPVMQDGTAIFTSNNDGLVRCSLGFNVYSVVTLEHFFITAGHCTHEGPDWYALVVTPLPNFSFLGSTSGTPDVFGLAGDFGVVRYEADGIRAFGTVAGTSQTITGAGDPVVGQSVQRSGSTTGVHGGTVTALNATVTYVDGITVQGLIGTTVCAERGDSGGPLYSGSTGLGLTSGGIGDCSSGGITYFQPVAPILGTYGLHLW